MYFGVLNLNKPAGMTSREAVDFVQPLVKPARAGHAGTLDPLATGVLVVCVGPATRLIEYVQRMPKRYTAAFLLGCTSETDDVDSLVTELDDPPRPPREAVVEAAGRMVGAIQQRPPAYSAIKVNGRRAYELARRGQAVELPPREVIVYSVQVVAYDYPRLVLEVECGSGTYIRSLGRDLAVSLGTKAVMAELVRTAVGGFTIDAAHDVRDLTPEALDAWLLPPGHATGLPTVVLDEQQLRRLSNGQAILRDDLDASTEYAGLDAQGRLRSVIKSHGQSLWSPVRNFAADA